MEYIAVVHKEKGSDYGVSFPDFAGCVTAGRTLEEAKEMAAEALEGHIEAMKAEGLDIPAPSSLDEVVLTARGKYADSVAAFFMVSVRGRKQAVRFNATMEGGLLHEVDATAQALGMTRSGLLAQAATHYIREQRRAS